MLLQGIRILLADGNQAVKHNATAGASRRAAEMETGHPLYFVPPLTAAAASIDVHGMSVLNSGGRREIMVDPGLSHRWQMAAEDLRTTRSVMVVSVQ